MSAEIRQAINLYLADIGPAELAVLDAATRKAQEDIAEMTSSMRRTIELLDRTFAEIDALRDTEEASAR
jgi:hypothetical protein